ncbi:MAG: dihydrodipicolinate synthase family protein [SAR202 cluster bacterium]|nr:dihydrodipicolinate synthase family protein [SAR202 cluster bacterium]|tara:strand:+ start:3112 stop:4014 length:903 start_codon:yes stop_codon:yes gene_type:complete
MPDRSMKGVYPILSAPIDQKGRLVISDLENQVEWMISKGVHGLGIAVATEIYKFNEAERDQILKTVVDVNNGRVKVVMNTGAEGTDNAVDLSKRAEDLGADALMIRPTSFIPMPGSENVDYFGRIAESVSIPIFLQDQGTAQVPPAMAVACAKRHENLCYIKVETPPTVPRMRETQELSEGTGLVLFGGAGGAFAVEEFKRGSVGTMPGSTLPDMFVRVWNAFHNGDEGAANTEIRRYAPLISILAQGQGFANWIYKYIMVRRGVFSKGSDFARHPALRPDDEHYREIDSLLESLDLVGK